MPGTGCLTYGNFFVDDPRLGVSIVLTSHRHWLASLAAIAMLAGPFCLPTQAADPAVAALLKILKSGRLPAERLPKVVEMICRGGDAEDLGTVYELALTPESAQSGLQAQAFEALADAMQNRKVKPQADLSQLKKLIASGKTEEEQKTQLAAIKLAALWKVEAIRDELVAILSNPEAGEAFQTAALDGLVAIGGDASLQAIEKLSAAGKPMPMRLTATAALANFDLNLAAARAAGVLADLAPGDDPVAMLEAFFTKKNGPATLAAALEKVKLSTDAAKIALRTMYSVGQNDPALSAVLSRAAGVAVDPPPPTPEEVAKLVEEVNAHGDAARGEVIFRRGDVSCLKCHAISRAGGEIGPDLSAVGGTSPVDYLVKSVLMPDEQVKEAYETKIIATFDGGIFQGIITNRENDRITLKDAGGKVVVIPIDDIEEETKGKSLMPAGLTKFLTREELVDLVKFLSELGKAGSDYAIRDIPSIQRWRVLKTTNKDLLAESPNVEILRQYILAAPPESWFPVYGKVAGFLPLADAVAVAKSKVIYLQGEVQIIEPGELTLQINSIEGVEIWIDAEPFGQQSIVTTKFDAGRHKITLRVDTAARAATELRLEVRRPAGAGTQYEVVGGS